MPRLSEKLAFIASVRPQWIERIEPWSTGEDAVFPNAVHIPPDLLAACTVVPHRYDLVTHLPRGGMVAELGTMHGVFAKWILEASQPEVLHLFDRDFSDMREPAVRHGVTTGQVILHEGESATSIAALPEAHFDWIYVDADHSYEGVTRDIAAAWSRVKPGGYLAFDDYCVFSHRELLPYGVMRAVNEFVIRQGWPARFLALDAQGHCNLALQRPAQP